MNIHKAFKEYMGRDINKNHKQMNDQDIQYATALVYWIEKVFDLEYGFTYFKDEGISGVEVQSDIIEEREGVSTWAQHRNSKELNENIKKYIGIMKKACGDNDKGESILACVKYDCYIRRFRRSFDHESKEEFNRIWGECVTEETYELGKQYLERFKKLYFEEYYRDDKEIIEKE